MSRNCRELLSSRETVPPRKLTSLGVVGRSRACDPVVDITDGVTREQAMLGTRRSSWTPDCVPQWSQNRANNRWWRLASSGRTRLESVFLAALQIHLNSLSSSGQPHALECSVARAAVGKNLARRKDAPAHVIELDCARQVRRELWAHGTKLRAPTRCPLPWAD